MSDPAEVVSVIRHEVKPGSEAAYETWTKDVVPIAQEFPGHRGVTVMRPAPGSHLYTVVLHFDALDHLRAWLESDIRRQLLARIEPHLSRDTEVEIRPGLDFWLPPAGQPRARPYKQALLAWSVIYPLSVLVPWGMGERLDAVPWLKSLVVSGIIVGAMTWIIMPRLTRRLSKWLYE
jgi:uncharacterized protein